MRYPCDIATMPGMETKLHKPMEDFVTRGGLAELIASAQAGLEELRCTGNCPNTTGRLEAAIDGAAGACEEEAEAEHLRPRALQVTEQVGDLITVVAGLVARPVPDNHNHGGRFVDARVICHCGGAVCLHGAIAPTESLPVTWTGIPCSACELTYTFAWGSR